MRYFRIVGVLAAALGAWMPSPAVGAADDCHPAINTSKPQYVIGYGSLMEAASKQRTAPDTSANLPVMVTGYKRAWNTRGSTLGFSTTYLGVQAEKDAEMPAAIYRDFSDITATDQREVYYCRVAVETDTFRMLDGTDVPKTGQIWIYVNKPAAVHPPSEDFPIVQSYVDIFITGCLQLKEKVIGQIFDLDFAERCIVTTDGWSEHWVNDRIYPRRPLIYQPHAQVIDQLLKDTIPDKFKAIRIE